MCELHANSLHLNNRRDPTQTLTIRKRLEAEMNKRFRRLRGDIRRMVMRLPSLDITEIERIMRFIERRTEDLLLSDREPLKTNRLKTNLNMEGGVSWMTSILEQSWTRGLTQAVTELDRAGHMPEFFDAANIARNRAITQRRDTVLAQSLSELKGVTEEMQTLIRRELAAGIEAGKHPRDIARAINKRVQFRSQYRARLIARTETIRAHHKARMASFREAGVLGVTVKAEWLTAGDGLVCPECEAMEGRVFTLDEAENMIPLHPQCRCVARPTFEGIEEFEKAA